MNAAVVLAAGKGTRLRSPNPKVLHVAAGRSLLAWVLEALRPLDLDRIVVVVGHHAEQVSEHAAALGLSNLTCVTQREQLGTGHAVRVAFDSGALEGVKRILVLAGDVPAVTTPTLAAGMDRLDADRYGRPAATVLTTQLDDPTGYGRVVRDGDRITAIVEERDATASQLAIDEVNTGLYVFDATALRAALGRITSDNAQGEEYLTDTVALLADGGLAASGDQPVTGGVIGMEVPAAEAGGVNDRAQLARTEALLRQRILDGLMRAGVGVTDPAATYVDADVTVQPGAQLLPGVMLHGDTHIASGATVGPHSRLTDTQVAAEATVAYTVADGARIGERANVGPYTHLRQGTVLGADSKAGGFVETKNAVIGEGSKVPHLSYVGDADLGRDVNFGAGSITINYDGYDKFHTTIGDGAFVGSDTMLVAPVEIGPGAYIGAGSTITTDVPADALAFERGQRRTIDGWAARKRHRHEQDG